MHFQLLLHPANTGQGLPMCSPSVSNTAPRYDHRIMQNIELEGSTRITEVRLTRWQLPLKCWCVVRISLFAVALSGLYQSTLKPFSKLLRTAMPLISASSNAGDWHIVPSGKNGYSGCLCKNHQSHERLHKSMPHEGSLMLRESQDKTRSLAAMKPPVCIGTGWRIHRIILMSHFKTDMSELSKLSRALGQTGNSRNPFLRRTSLTQSVQQKAKSALTPQLGTLMGKPPLVSIVCVSHTGADSLWILLENTFSSNFPDTVGKGFLGYF